MEGAGRWCGATVDHRDCERSHIGNLHSPKLLTRTVALPVISGLHLHEGSSVSSGPPQTTWPNEMEAEPVCQLLTPPISKTKPQ